MSEEQKDWIQVNLDFIANTWETVDTPEEAAVAYEAAAIKYFGEFARAA